MKIVKLAGFTTLASAPLTRGGWQVFSRPDKGGVRGGFGEGVTNSQPAGQNGARAFRETVRGALRRTAGLWSFAVLALSVPAGAAPASDSGLIPLTVAGENIRLRAMPSTTEDSRTVGRADAGMILLAERWPIEEWKWNEEKQADEKTGTPWYRVVAIGDRETGLAAGKLAAGGKAPAYISAAFVKPGSWDEAGIEESAVMEVLSQTGYGQGYSTVDVTPENQRRILENQPIRELWPSSDTGKRIPVYSGPSTSSEALEDAVLVDKDVYNLALVVTETKPGWQRFVSLSAQLPSGWVEAGQLKPYFYEGDRREVGHFCALSLGANVPEIMRRWGPAQLVERRVEEECCGSIDLTKMAFDGLEVHYKDYRNFHFRLTRKGAAMGGVFVGADGFDKAYVDRVIGKMLPNPDKFTMNDGRERWQLSGGSDGNRFHMIFTFDGQGRVSEFSCSASDVDLSH